MTEFQLHLNRAEHAVSRSECCEPVAAHLLRSARRKSQELLQLVRSAQVAGQLLLAARRKAGELLDTIRDALTRDVEIEGPTHRRCPLCGESKADHAAGCPAGVR